MSSTEGNQRLQLSGNPIKTGTHTGNACKASAPPLGHFTSSNTARDLLQAENWAPGTNSLPCPFATVEYVHMDTGQGTAALSVKQCDKESCKVNTGGFIWKCSRRERYSQRCFSIRR